jgi:hypothetical protein
MKFFVLFGDALIHRMATDFGLLPANRIQDANVIFFPGGPDVDPSLYGEKRHRTTYCNPEKNKKELDIFNSFPGFKLGICGGGQALNVFNGGRMFQDSDHPGEHELSTTFGVFTVNSTHHQLMRLGSDAELLGWTNIATYRETMSDDLGEDEPDNEIIWYPKTKSLCFQPHPEYGHKSTTRLYKEVLEYIGVL